VILTNGSAALRSLQKVTQTTPIVFTSGPDPVAAGLVRNIARPEGNITGFGSSEPTLPGKQLGLLKGASPQLVRVALIFNTELAGQIASSYFAAIDAAAAALSVRAIQMPVRNAVDVVHAVDAFATEPSGGLLILPPPPTTGILEAILQLAAQHRLPAI